MLGVRSVGVEDFAHGVVEAQAEDLDEEVDGVAGLVALGPAPVRVFDNESWVGRQPVIAGAGVVEFDAAALEQWG